MDRCDRRTRGPTVVTAHRLRLPAVDSIPLAKDTVAEEQVLGAILLAPEVLPQAGTDPEIFFDPDNRTLFRLMLELDRNGTLITADALFELARSKDLLNGSGGVDRIIELIEAVPHAGRIAGYVRVLRETLWRRQTQLDILNRFHAAVDPALSNEDLATYLAGTLRERSRDDDLVELAGLRAPKWESTLKDARYLINGILPAEEHGILGGPPKALKTRLIVATHASLATGDNLFGVPEYFIPERVRSHLIAGETTYDSALRTLKRIAYAAGRPLEDYGNFSMVKRIVDLKSTTDIDRIKALVVRERIRLLTVDPLYLMCRGIGNGQNNMMMMADYLGALARVSEATGATVLVAHHFPKSATRVAGTTQQGYGVPDLTWLAGAGCDAWARFYWLVNRRNKFDETAPGIHKLWLSVGGESAEPRSFALDVDEAKAVGHTWKVICNPAHEIIDQIQAERVEQVETLKAQRRQATQGIHRQKLLTVFQRFPRGESKRVLRDSAGLATNYFNVILSTLLTEGTVEECVLHKKGREFAGYKLSGEPGKLTGEPLPLPAH